MIKELIEKVVSKENLSFDESHQAMLRIMEGEINHAQIAGLLIALKCKGESPAEVAGFASAMREKSVKINPGGGLVVDVCGTGGDSSGMFNISTTASFVVAGTSVKVAKHGNRSISSSSGSADVLKELGVQIDIEPEQSEKALNEAGIAFLFAPRYHPAMKHVMPVRRELAMRTVFNILGPLTNPAGTKYQLVGTFSNQTAKLMASASEKLQMAKVCFVCTDGRYDEILLNGTTRVYEFTAEKGLREYEVTNETFGYPKVDINEIKGSTPQHNARILRSVLDGKEKGPFFYVTAANAAMGLYSAGYSPDLQECARSAEESILSGKAKDKLEQLIGYGN